MFGKKESRDSLPPSLLSPKLRGSSKRSSVKLITVEKEGWLLKKGNKRYFLLDANQHVLYWFKKEMKTLEEDEIRKKASGSFQFGPGYKIAPVENSKKFQFKITGHEKGEYTITCKTQEELTSWTTTLNNAIQSRNKISSPATNRPATTITSSTSADEKPVETAPANGTFEKQGLLTDKNKKTCFYRMKNDHLLWFPSEKESKFLGSLDMAGATLEVTSPNSFILRSGEVETELTAKTNEQARDWITHLNNSINELKKTPLFFYNQETEWRIRVEAPVGNEWYGVAYKSTNTAEAIKNNFIEILKAKFPESFGDFVMVDAFLLKVRGINYYIIDENKPLHALNFFQTARKAFAVPKLELIHKLKLREQGISLHSLLQTNEKDLNAQTESKQQTEINSLVGNGLLTLLAGKSLDRENEVNCFRRAMAKFRLESFDEIKDKLPEYLESEPIPKNCPASINLICNLPGDKHKTLSCEVNQTVAELKDSIFDKYKKIDVSKTIDKSVNDYILKVTGYRSYFVTMDKQVINYDYIRACINKNEKISLSLVEFDKSLLIQKERIPMADILMASEEENDLYTEDELKIVKKPYIPLSEKKTLFNVRINNATNVILESLPEASQSGVSYVQVEVYHGGVLIDGPICTRDIPYVHYNLPSQKDKNQCFWNQTLACTIPLCNLPKAARVSLTVYVKLALDNEPRAVGWANLQLIDHKSRFVSGPRDLRLWPGKVNPIGSCVDNIGALNPTFLSIEFEKITDKIPIYVDLKPSVDGEFDAIAHKRASLLIKELQPVIMKDSLAVLSRADYNLIWEFRDQLVSIPKALPKFLLSVQWNNPDHIREAYRLLKKWEPLTPVQALELLDAKFADAKVREYAINILSQLNDGDLNDYLLQLTQVLKYEPHHDSALARFLLKRALNSKDIIGHSFFWHLKAEIHMPEIAERYGLLIESYLRGCGSIYRYELYKQNDITNQLTEVALKIKEIKNKEERLEAVKYHLRQIEFPPRFQLPLFTNVECKGLIIEKCKVMTSKKLPLWLVFENADRNGEKLYIIFKCGDDLRQDVLTLQMIRLMDKLWIREGINLRLKPYGVISTGDQIGMLQVVLDSETTASINREAGGATSVLQKDIIAKWVRSNNQSDEEYKQAVETFALSCAGYCVATYVIGIGDRHNDNIMLHRKGNLFHIDFGHFLGHFKTKFGFEREKAPFVFTPQYAQVLGGKNGAAYQQFEDTCCTAYNIIRKNSVLFINLFSMMLSIGLAELQSVDNIMFLRDQLALDKTDDQASVRFKALIEESLNTKTTQFMDVVHILAN